MSVCQVSLKENSYLLQGSCAEYKLIRQASDHTAVIYCVTCLEVALFTCYIDVLHVVF